MPDWKLVELLKSGNLAIIQQQNSVSVEICEMPGKGELQQLRQEITTVWIKMDKCEQYYKDDSNKT